MGASSRPVPDFAPRQVGLPHGRTLEIRPITPADVDGLAALYEDLDDEDRHRRFFTSYRPGREFLERVAGSADSGGFGLVAVVAAEGGDRIVAEADYTLLPDGDGELAVTVAGGWRGWLGPYLLDALLEAASARGVPNLQADILVTNQPMLALVRSRGYATMEHPDWTVVRVLIGTGTRTPTWPGPHDRPRVLVEVPGGHWHAEEAARAAGLQVLMCSGPGASQTRCPALAGEPCPLAAGADVIVVSRPPGDERWQELVRAHPHLHAGVPICLEVPVGSAGTEPEGACRVPSGDDEAVVAFVGRLAGAGQGEPDAATETGIRHSVDDRAPDSDP